MKDLTALRKSGLDFIRLPVDPGPLLALLGQERSQLMVQIESAIHSILAADLSVILDLHPNEATHFWNGRQMLAEGADGSFNRFTDLVIDMARLLKNAPRDRTALELINEPPLPCNSPDWARQQVHLLAAARSVAPDLMIIVTGACGSLPEGLLAFDPREPRDQNVFYTFHYYRPYLFSHQGAAWMRNEPYYGYLRNVPWPAASGTLESAESAFREQIAADTKLSLSAQVELTAKAKFALAKYFLANADKSYIEQHFSSINEWREKHGIEANRVLLGEFGATKYANPDDRARYLHDVRTAAEAHGFAWAFYNLFDAMGLTIDDHSRVLNGAILGALGLDASG
jgi:hypothetical protein